MPITANPYVLRDVSVTLKLASDAVGTPVEYKCQLTQATLTPSSGTAGGGSTLETFCSTYSSGSSGGTTWTLDLAGFLALADATDLSRFLFENDGELADFVMVPGPTGTVSTSNPGFEGQVTLVATAIGGTANQYPTWTVSLPCTAKPSLITTAPAAA